jgi:hypothetical protein
MKRWFTLLTLVLAPGVLSCGDDSPVAPATSPQFNLEADKLGQLARYESGSMQIRIGIALKTIGPEGGRIAVGGFEAIVPPGAVAQPTRFSIRLPVDPYGSEYVRAEFGPHQEFAAPITIRLPLQGTTAEHTAAHVLWWSGTSWVQFPTTTTSDGRIETQTWHFSEFGTEGPSKGIILIGG